jgi:hypothetical protein
MKLAVSAALMIALLPLLSYGQSTLTFPRVIQTTEMSTTGFAIVNPGPDNASATFTLYGADGSQQAATTQTIPKGGQFAKLAGELFPAAAAAGWVQVSSPSPGLQGFWFAGDLVTFADGADAAVSSNEIVLPLISPFSQIHIANTGSSDVTVLLELLGPDGFDPDYALPLPQHILPKGAFRGDMAALFPNLTDYSWPSHMRISCKCTNGNLFAATVIARNYLAAPSWAVSNGVAASSTATKIYFPQLVDGPQGGANWKSMIGLTNLSTTTPNAIDATFVSNNGATVRSHQTLPPNGGLRIRAQDLFGFTGGIFQNGSVTVTSATGLPLTGYIAYADLINAGVAVVPPQQEAHTNLLFAHIADLPPWFTGIALLNTNSAPANIELFAINPNGSLIGSTTFTLPAGTSSARLLRDLVPQTQTRTSDGGFVFVRANAPIFGIELFFSRNLQVLANVAAGTVPPGITFVPPTR